MQQQVQTFSPHFGPRSLRGLQLAHGLFLLVLLFAVGVIGAVGVAISERDAAETRRIGSLLATVEQTRGDLYRQLKEVFDYHFLEDPEAKAQYRNYSNRLSDNFKVLNDLVKSDAERRAVGELQAGYGLVKTNIDAIMAQPMGAIPDADELEVFDTELEGGRLSVAEAAFAAAESFLGLARAELAARASGRWPVALALLLVPAGLAGGLILFARGFLRRAFARPLAEVLDVMARYGKGRFDARAPVGGAAEMVDLQHAINHMADELQSSREALIRSEKQAALGALVPVMAHNIRNPLASIRATAQVVDDPALTTDTRQLLGGIVVAVDRLERWLSSLLTYLEPGRANLKPGRLADCTDSALELMGPKIAEKSLVVVRNGWDTPESAPLDAHLIEQAIFGLLTNAVEASPDGATITLGLGADEQAAWLTIADQGPGIAFRPDPAAAAQGPTTKTLGHGLGIPFAFKVCDLHGASLDFSEATGVPEAGTVVTLRVPRRPPAGAG